MFALPAEYILLINGALIVMAIIIAIFLVRMGEDYSDNIGDSIVQARLRKVILRLLMVLLLISLLAAVFNLLSEAV